MKQRQFKGVFQFLKEKEIDGDIEKFCVDLTFLADKGYIDNSFCRNDLVEKMIVVLSKKTKSNVMLVGDPGVGKTALVENLAYRIAKKEVPFSLCNKRIMSLSLPKLIAGAKYRGDLEERLDSLLNTIKESTNYILFIDEIHNILNSGSGQSGGLDIGNIIKPILARGGFQCIGATTLDEYSKFFVDKDPALARRFQNVNIPEMSIEETFSLLKNKQEEYEKFHFVEYSDKILRLCISLCDKFILNKPLPDKVLDFIDNVGAYMNNIITNHFPKELKKDINEINSLKEKKINAFNHFDIDNAAKYIDLIKQKEKSLNKKLIEYNFNKNKVKVTENHLIDIFIRQTGYKIVKYDKIKYILDLKKKLNTVLDQRLAIEEISNCLYEKLKSEIKKSPLCIYFFCGHETVGKTKIVEILAKELFEGENNFLQIDCSIFSEINGSNITKLINKIRFTNIGLIHFYNVTSGNKILHLLLRKILSFYNEENFKQEKKKNANLIIIIESTIGVEFIKGKIGFTNENEVRVKKAANDILESLINAFHYGNNKEIKEILEKYIDKRLLDLCDKIIIFNNLSKKTVQKIIVNMFEKIVSNIQDIYKVKIICDKIFLKSLSDIYNEVSNLKETEKMLTNDIFMPSEIFITNNKLANSNKEIKISFDFDKKTILEIVK